MSWVAVVGGGDGDTSAGANRPQFLVAELFLILVSDIVNPPPLPLGGHDSMTMTCKHGYVLWS